MIRKQKYIERVYFLSFPCFFCSCLCNVIIIIIIIMIFKDEIDEQLSCVCCTHIIIIITIFIVFIHLKKLWFNQISFCSLYLSLCMTSKFFFTIHIEWLTINYYSSFFCPFVFLSCVIEREMYR